MSKTVAERILDNIEIDNDTGCWNWQGGKNQRGYGLIQSKDDDGIWKSRAVHRVSYELYNGSIPVGLLACHHCDNPSCCNPQHIYIGTQKMNMADMISKGRKNPSRGANHWKAKVSDDEIASIRDNPDTYSSIGLQYGISASQVHRIKSRQSWKHIA